MIVCHTHRFVFVKTYETAGTSIEIELSRLCGPADVVTPLLPRDEEIRQALGRAGPQNTTVLIRHHTVGDAVRLVTRRQRATYTPHLSAVRVRSHIGQLMWRGYLTFAIERNPFDKAVGMYQGLGRMRQQVGTIDDWIAAEPVELSDWPLYTRGDRIIVDHVGRYDDLPATFATLSEHVGIEIEAPGVRATADTRFEQPPPSEALDAASQATIERICRREIAEFGFRCE